MKTTKKIALTLAALAALNGFAFADEKGNEITDWAGQPESAKTGLFPSWFLVTGILLALSFLAMWFFPLHGKAWEDTKKELAIEHQKKEEAYEQKILAEMQANQATGEAQ